MIIFLYGEDSFRSGQKVAELKKKFLEKDKSGSGLSIFDFAEAKSAQNFLDVLGVPNLLSPKRLVIIKRLISDGQATVREEAEKFFKKEGKKLDEDRDMVAVFWEEKEPKKSDALFKFFVKNAKTQKFEKLGGSKLEQWVLLRLKEVDHRAKISKTALAKLIAFTAGDIFCLDKEAQKLANYASGRMIKDEDVENLVKANLNNSIFNTIDALAARNKKEALKLLHQHMEKGEDPFYILSMFVYQFRNLLKITDLQENQKMNEYEIAKISKLHPFVIKKGMAQSRNFAAEGKAWNRLKQIYKKLSDIDMAVKTGKIEIKLALDKFIVEL